MFVLPYSRGRDLPTGRYTFEKLWSHGETLRPTGEMKPQNESTFVFHSVGPLPTHFVNLFMSKL